MEFSANLSAIYTKLCTQSFPPIFALFAIFDSNFSKIVAPPKVKNENSVVHLKKPSLLKKTLLITLKSAYKWQRNACCTARTHGAPDSERDRQKQSQLETKASSHGGQCIPAGYCHAHMLLYESGVNYNLNSKYTKYFAQLCARIFTFWNISTTHYRLVWRHLPTKL